ncbi:GNAT family N-acetyltransferase [Albibacterium indicum]|uniref:GNAT family N-acetyltransferase n=1 Tax=Albibacterium indicum TaxID=2292082 RepID=UPI000E4F158F|nr:GNAT family N-acetyltransferase [Pedobacter indicus]
MNIICKAFEELTNKELYDLLQLRSEIFVVEQACTYQDLDGVDFQCHHLLIYDQRDKLQAYARLIPAGLTFFENSIGRIVTREHGKGLGRILMKIALVEMNNLFGEQPIRIGAQTYALKFYQNFGFKTDSDTYHEDGIEHVEMLRP